MNDTPRTSEAAGYPSNDWEATAERLFECSQKLERENNLLREALKRRHAEQSYPMPDYVKSALPNALHELPPPCGSECNQDAHGG